MFESPCAVAGKDYRVCVCYFVVRESLRRGKRVIDVEEQEIGETKKKTKTEPMRDGKGVERWRRR